MGYRQLPASGERASSFRRAPASSLPLYAITSFNAESILYVLKTVAFVTIDWHAGTIINCIPHPHHLRRAGAVGNERRTRRAGYAIWFGTHRRTKLGYRVNRNPFQSCRCCCAIGLPHSGLTTTGKSGPMRTFK